MSNAGSFLNYGNWDWEDSAEEKEDLSEMVQVPTMVKMVVVAMTRSRTGL